MRRIIICLLLVMFPILSWGQSRIVQDKIARANAIKNDKGICIEYIDALMVASDEAFKENEMDTALLIQKELVISIPKVYPNDADLLSNSEGILSLLYLQCEMYAEAYPLQKSCYDREKGSNVESDLESLDLLSYSAYKLGLNHEAIEYRKEKLELIDKHYGKNSMYAENLYLLAFQYKEIDNLEIALSLIKESVNLYETLNETNSSLYQKAIQMLKELEHNTGSDETNTLSRQHLENMARYYETDDVKYIHDALNILDGMPESDQNTEYKYRSLSALYQHYLLLGSYKDAIDIILKLPHMHSADWFYLGFAMNNVGDFYNAKESYKYAWAASYQENNDVTDEFFSYFESYAQACINIGTYQEAFEYLEKFYAGDMAVKGREINAALYMYVLAQLKHSIGDYAGAASCAMKCKEVFLSAKILAEYEMCQLIIANYYEMIEDYTACIGILEELANVEGLSGKAMTYKAMLPLYTFMNGNIEAANKLYDDAKRIYKTYTFDQLEDEYVYLNSLGLYAQKVKDFQSAEGFYKKAIECAGRIDYPDHVNYALRLLSLAALYLEWPGHETNALSLCSTALDIVKEHYDANFPSYFAFSLNNLYAKYVNEISVSNEEIVSLIDDERIQVQYLLCQMTEKERDSFWRHHEDTKDLIFSLVATSDVLYDYTLFYKGILLSSTREIGRIVQIANDAELNTLYGRYITVKQLANNNSKESEDKLRAIEREILKKCIDLGYAINDRLGFSDVIKALEKDEVAIEFVDYKKLGTASDTLAYNKYVALLLKKGFATPICIDLCNEEDLNLLVNTQDKAYSEDALYDLLWKPLEKYIPKGSKVYYSPAGLIHKVSFEAIKVAKNSILADKYELKRLSSTRELALSAVDTDGYATSAVYGGLVYNVPADEFMQNSQLYADRKNGSASSLITRGGAEKTAWRFLPGTRNEAETIAKLLESNNVSCDLYVGAQGNEESFKGLSGDSPAIIHVATHGFYIEPNKNSSSTNTPGVRGQIQNEESALRRSGLIMAGANAAWIEGTTIPNVDDGVLTAEEISQMDLRNTVLAIISACDSGLGNITDDGIEGLIRGFKSAGVKSIIATLWKVDDAATELMMTEFYKNLTNGSSREDSFMKARNSVRAKYEEPYYWAPFILID